MQHAHLCVMVLLWSGSIPIPSWHTTTVPLRSTVAVTVADDVMDPVITSVTLNWKVRDHPTLVTRKNRLNNTKRWNTPLMWKRGNCTCECHTLPRTWSLHTGLQLSTWSWRWTMNLANNKQGYIKNGLFHLIRVPPYGWFSVSVPGGIDMLGYLRSLL